MQNTDLTPDQLMLIHAAFDDGVTSTSMRERIIQVAEEAGTTPWKVYVSFFMS